jgi:hypothetical protein
MLSTYKNINRKNKLEVYSNMLLFTPSPQLCSFHSQNCFKSEPNCDSPYKLTQIVSIVKTDTSIKCIFKTKSITILVPEDSRLLTPL